MRMSFAPSLMSFVSTAKRLGAAKTSAPLTLRLAMLVPLTVTSYSSSGDSSLVTRR